MLFFFSYSVFSFSFVLIVALDIYQSWTSFLSFFFSSTICFFFFALDFIALFLCIFCRSQKFTDYIAEMNPYSIYFDRNFVCVIFLNKTMAIFCQIFEHLNLINFFFVGLTQFRWFTIMPQIDFDIRNFFFLLKRLQNDEIIIGSSPDTIAYQINV